MATLTMFEKYQKVIQQVLNYVSYEDMKNIRAVNRLCKECVQNSDVFQKKTTFNFNGGDPRFRNCPEKLDETIQFFLHYPFGWTRLNFINMFLERDLMGKEPYFNAFVENYCSGLKSLQLTNSSLGLGRLVEFLSFCPALEELEIRRCPSIFNTGTDITNWAAFIPYFYRTLSRLKVFAIEDSGETFKAYNLSPWLKYMRKLVKLELKNTSGKIELPMKYIFQVLGFNTATLRHLSLIGSCIYELTSTDCGSLRTLGLNLERLTLGTFKLGDPMNFSAFIKQQKHLRYFELQRITLRPPCFYKISDLQFLEHVVLRDCYLDERTYICLGPLTRASSVKKLDLILSTHQETAENWTELFKNSPQRTLQQLHISMSYAAILLPKISENCSNLHELSLVGLCKVFGERIPLHLIYELSNLRSLSLKSCGLQDSDFVSEIHNLGSKTLSDLQKLNYLDLSFNEITLETIMKQVVLLPVLQELIISGTLIAKENLFQIKLARHGGRFQELRRLVAQNCRNLRLTPTEHVQLVFVFGDVKLILDVPMKKYEY